MKVSEIAFVAYPATAELKAKSVRFEVEGMETPVCRMAIIADPDDNKITIHKRHPQAH
ncbi:MAG TPA: hypothetical protein VHS80_09155 [Chthoniobacterales bacterium]|nr:hypothetical protein [Chthoniobacterales bacterium]